MSCKPRFTKRTLLTLAGLGVAVALCACSIVYAGNQFFPSTLVYYSDNGSKATGSETTPNSTAIAYSYRTTTDGNINSRVASDFGITQSPSTDHIFPADYDFVGEPARASWDTGSSSWTFAPLTGDVIMMVLETRAGLNGWTGDSWVGGAKVTLTDLMLSNSTAEMRDTVMEPIPTPSMQSNTTSSITIHWQGLWDNDTGAAGGSGPASVVGYSIYRNVDGGSYSLLNNVAQSAGSNIAYTDGTATTGHTYTYKLGVRFEWLAHTGGFLEPAAQGPASAALSTGVPQPVMLKYLSTAPSFAAGNKSAVQTVQSSDVSGNAISVTSDTTVDLTTNSSGANAKFYSVSGGVCTSTQITSIVISTGTNTAQFCYYDEKAGSWTLTSASTGLTSATETATVTGGSTLGSINLSLTSPQKNHVAFTGANTLTATDSFGNTMTSFSAASDNVTFTVAPATAVASGLNGTGSAQLTVAGDFASGVANLAGKLKLGGTSGTYTVTATTASGKTSNASVTLSGGALDHFDFTLASPQVIDVAFTGTNTLTARDADNNIITSFDASTSSVTVTENGSTGTVSGLGSGGNTVLNRSTDFVNGVANLTSAIKYVGPVGSHVFKATSGAVSSTSNSVSFTPGAFAKFGVNINATQANATAFTTATITAQDTYGNTLSSFDAGADHVTLSVSGTGSLNTTSLASSGSFVNSVADLSNSLTFTGQAGSHTITVTSASGKTGTATVTITAGTPTSAKIVNGSSSAATQVTTSALNADQTLSLWAAGYDVSGNWSGLLSGSWGSTGTLAPTVTNTGVSTMVFAPTTAPTSGTITFTNGSLSAATGTITVTVGALNHFVVSAPGTATAGQQFTASITAVDADGNTVTTYTGAQTLAFSGPGNGATGGTPTYPASVNFANGVASSVPITLVKAETVKLTATQGSASGQSGNIVVSSAAPNSFGVSTPGAVTAGTPFDVQITAYDQYGNVDTAYTGSHALSFANPSNAPDGTAPSYPSSTNFADGVATASVTLFKRETTSLKVTENTLTGTSGTVAVAAGAAASIAEVSGNHQTSPVSQTLPLPAKVIVKDAYQNAKNLFDVSFAVTAGGGSINASTVTTATDGTAQVSWVLGSAPGTDNNIMEASATGLTGSPVVFMASASGNGFAITTPSKAQAGQSFAVQIKVIDMNGETVTSYTGTKTLTFSGPANGPNGDAPVYPVSVTFVNGVANPVPSITLVAVETTTLTIADGTLSGTSVPFTVDVGEATKLTIVTAPQQIKANEVSGPITVCRQDQYGNAVIGSSDRIITMAGTSPGSKFSISADGPWDSYQASLVAGSNCLNVYYKDSYAGSRMITLSSTGLLDAAQSLIVNATTEPSAPGGTTTPTTTTTPTATNTTNTVTVYVDRPTRETNLPSPSATTTITVPGVSLPIITSPSKNAFIAAIDGNVIIEGTAPPKRSLRVATDTGITLGSDTSDQFGQWRILVSQKKFKGAQQSIYAQMVGNDARGTSVQFSLKQSTFLERVVDFVAP